MGLLFKRFKTKFRYSLKPVFAMLVARRRELNEESWTLLFRKIQNSISTNPQEYLGEELPEPSLLRDILDEIFKEFLKERAYHEAASYQMGKRDVYSA
jgi:hypothetical protein